MENKFTMKKNNDKSITIFEKGVKSCNVIFIENEKEFIPYKDKFEFVKNIDFPLIIINHYSSYSIIELPELNIILSFVSYCMSGIDIFPETIIDHKESFNEFCHKRYGTTDSEFIWSQITLILNIPECINDELFKAYKTGAQDMYDNCINILSGFLMTKSDKGGEIENDE